MTTPQPSTDTPRLDEFDPDVRCAAWRLLANSCGGEYLPAAVADTVKHRPDLVSDILKFLAVFGFQAASQVRGGDYLAARFIGDELDIAEFAHQLEVVERVVWE